MSEIIDFESVMRDQMIVTSGRINPSTVKMLVDMGFRITKQSAAPAPPQPTYDEAKERELFEVHYRDQFEAETGRELSDDDIKSLRDGPLYGKSRTYLNGQWVGWQACAQSRAKAGEVGHE